jgi:hypothetical protein
MAYSAQAPNSTVVIARIAAEVAGGNLSDVLTVLTRVPDVLWRDDDRALFSSALSNGFAVELRRQVKSQGVNPRSGTSRTQEITWQAFDWSNRLLGSIRS